MSANGIHLSAHPRSRSHVAGLYQMKEYSLMRNFESLKCSTNASILFPNVNNSTQSKTSVASLLPIALSSEQTDVSALKSKPHSSKWAADPTLVSGNLRSNPEIKSSPITLEEFLKHGSSIYKNECEQGDVADTGFIEGRKTQTSKKKASKRINSKGLSSSSPKPANDKATSTLFNPFLKHPKGNHTNSNAAAVSAHGIESLTALCKGAKFHDRARSSSLNTKHASISRNRRSALTNTTPFFLASPSPSRASLNNGVNESSRKTVTNNTRRPPRQMASKEDTETKQTKVFLSEKQSGVLSDCGMVIPCAPPATPTADQLKKYEYVPSLQDIRAQRSVRQRLQVWESQVLNKEEKLREADLRAEKSNVKERTLEIKKRQRQEIYALNKVMTELEHENFVQFMRSNGLNL